MEMVLMLETLAAAMIAIQGGYSMPSAPPPAPRPEQRAAPKAATAAAPVTVTTPRVAAIPGKMLKDVPNITIRYFDVAGKNLKAINKSIANQEASRARATPTNWSIDMAFNKATGNGGCRITSAKATFSANVGLPRLVADKAHKPQLLADWRAYLADIETIQAANFWFVHDRMGEVEKAIVASTCEGAQAAGNAALERLKAQAAEFQRANAAPAPAPAPAAK